MRMIRVITYEGSEEWIDSVKKDYCELSVGYAWSVSASVSDGGGGTITETFRVTTESEGLAMDELAEYAEDEAFRLTNEAEAKRIENDRHL